MSKTMLAFMLLASVALYDPQVTLHYVGPQVQMIGGHLKSVLQIDRFLPGIGRFGAG